MLSQQPIAYPNVGAPLGGLPQAGVNQVGQFPPQAGVTAPMGVIPQQQYAMPAAQAPPPVPSVPAPVPAPAPAPAPSQSKIADDFDEIFGFTTPKPAPAAPAVPEAPAPVAPAPTAVYPPADVGTAGVPPTAAFQATAATGYGIAPQGGQPATAGVPQTAFTVPAAAPAAGVLPTTAPTVAGLPPTGVAQPSVNPAVPSSVLSNPALGGIAPTAATTPTPAPALAGMPTPGMVAGTTAPQFGALAPTPGLQPTPDLTTAMLGMNVGGAAAAGLQPTPGLQPSLTPGLGAVGGVPMDPSLMGVAGNDELLEVERKQRDSMRAIQKIKDEIMALKGQTETASMERRARDNAAHQQAHAAQSAQVAAHSAIQEENKRMQERDDENLARQLQAMEGAQPPRSSTTQYEGVGGVSQLEQEQRDLALAQEMQNEENKSTRGSGARSGGYNSSQPAYSQRQAQSYGGSYGSNSGTSYEGVGGVSRLEQEQRDMALAQEMQDQENRKSSQRGGSSSNYGTNHQGDGETVRVQSVSVCDTQVLDTVTYYIVQVSMTNGKSWKLQKRYSVFDTLHQKFSNAGYPGSNFPPKSMFKVSGQGIEQRRAQLNMWLSDLVEKAKVEHRPMELRAALMDFLELEQRA
eukprot:TRINITY_DN3045_c0_g2_i3.p1 TRINITY_DN3045_c0_g2~~TRINITY_DN3045_c0_g2_i3.p1  ORF type:complete len:632 (+),score=157.75 TRINITY_DN3045_c0_g2_i3:72-1967(+)